MKKHIAIISSIIILTVLLNITAISNAVNNNTDTGISTQEEKEINYILKDCNGQLALFEAGNDKPVEIYNIYTDSLPEQDATALKQGITVTPQELKKALEEFTS